MGEQIREDITVVMSAQNVQVLKYVKEYKRGFGVPTLIAVRNQMTHVVKVWQLRKHGRQQLVVTVLAY